MNMISRENVVKIIKQELWKPSSTASSATEQSLYDFDEVVRIVAQVRADALEEAAKVCEGGRFLHDDAPDAIFGKACAKAIRAIGEK